MRHLDKLLPSAMALAVVALMTPAAHAVDGDSQYSANRTSAKYVEGSRSGVIEQANVRSADLPPNAAPGECYARVWLPPQYASRTEPVLSREADQRIEIIPARYETITEQLLIQPASEKLIEIPAEYGWEEERLLVEPASTEWKASDCSTRGAIPNSTGECMCLVEVPARYETVKRRVMRTPPSTQTVAIPPEYRTVQKTVMASPPRERRIDIPAEYKSVTHKEKVRDGEMVWMKIACDPEQAYALSPSSTRSLQRALNANGYDAGPADGVFGSKTRTALLRFQTDKGLALGVCDSETLRALNAN